ncbi:MAG TPA: hypothetical protein VNM67_21870 [Thermoanaerobaculia bacterium]|nr:hypothetical protein [Thermoanaerobaculia bacterium]
MKKIAAAVLGLSGLLLAGCFDIEQTLTLEKNMSGKAGYAMKFDMKPMVGFMAGMKRAMEGKEGPPTAEEIAAVEQEMLASSKAERKIPSKEEIAKNLPKGVTLLDSKVQEDGLKFGMNVLFGFDHISKLQEIELKSAEPEKAQPPEAPAPPGPGAQGPNPMESPFGGLQFKDEGDTFLVTSPANNPIADQKEQASQMEMSPEDKKQIEEMLGKLRVAFKITAPFKVVEHNAHRKEGNTLIWEYNLESFEKMKPEDLAQGVRVRYKK